MAESILSLELRGREALLDAWSYRDALNAFLGLLREIDVAVTLEAGKPGPSLNWFIRSLHASNPTMELLAESKLEDLDVSARVIQLTQDSLETLERSPVRPLELPYTALEKCQELGEVIRRDSITEIIVTFQRREIMVTHRLEAHVREVMGQKVETLGSVQGQLEMVTLRGRRYFNVYNLVTGKATRCLFDPSLFERVREALGKVVAVKGVMRTFAHEEGREVTDIAELIILEDDTDLPTPEDVRGIMPGFTGGLPSGKYVKERWRGKRQT